MLSIGTGQVARLVTGDELILNLGSEAGVKEGDVFEILDPRTMDVQDPSTGENLGSIPRRKATVRVVTVTEKISLARNTRPGLAMGEVAAILSGSPRESLLAGDRWLNGVTVGDPVRKLDQ